MVPVSESLYVGKTEVTNLDYRIFLEDNPELKERFRPDSLQWLYLKTEGLRAFATSYSWHPGYDHYPVVNISKEAAEAYCRWLTNTYHLMKNRKFKKVAFRLPTEKEWNEALKPLPGHGFPWYGNYPYNTKGVFMANIKYISLISEDTVYTDDGGLGPVMSGVYLSNPYGLNHMIGNIAEMISDKPYCKGGSWDSFIEECAVNLNQDYQLPDPRAGFRVFMEIIEK